MGTPKDADKPTAKHNQWEYTLLLLLVCVAFLSLSGSLVNLIVPSFHLWQWVLHGSGVGTVGKVVVVILPVGLVGIGVTNVVFGRRFFERSRFYGQ